MSPANRAPRAGRMFAKPTRLLLLIGALTVAAPLAGNAQTRLLADDASGLAAALLPHAGDLGEWWADSSYRLTATWHGRFDLGVRLASEETRYNIPVQKTTGQEIFAHWVARPPATPRGFGVEVRAAYGRHKDDRSEAVLPGPFPPPPGTYYDHQQVYRLGGCLWQKPTTNVVWSFGVFGRVRRAQVRLVADDETLVGQDAFEFGFAVDLAVRVLDVFTLEVGQELSRDQLGETGWWLESYVGLGILVGPKGAD